MTDETALKPLVWVGSARKDFGAFPDDVKSTKMASRSFWPNRESGIGGRKLCPGSAAPA